MDRKEHMGTKFFRDCETGRDKGKETEYRRTERP
jgi:hypothetical protein